MSIETLKIFVTGASGFIGGACAERLALDGHEVLRGTRSSMFDHRSGQDWVRHGDLEADGDWAAMFVDCDCVVHCAGPASVPESEPERSRCRAAIVEGTTRLVKAASKAGVRRFVFISSALVHAPSPDDEGGGGKHAAPSRFSSYARFKLEAEERLKSIAGAAGMEWVIIRPPMVYGPGSKGNFARLADVVHDGWPLPLALARAPKSFVALDNLASAVKATVEHPRAAGRTFIVCDNEASSTADLVHRIAAALGCKARLVPVPSPILRSVGLILGRQADIDSLLRPMPLDGSEIRRDLGWTPPLSLDQGVAVAVREWLRNARK
jgi:nucleoside-diphosphate-sugar epimerase